MTRKERLDLLSRLSPSQFEEVLRQTNTPAADLPGKHEAQTTRAIDVIDHLERHDQLDQLARVLNELVGRDSQATTASARSRRAVEAGATATARNDSAHRLIKRTVAGQTHEIPNWGIWRAGLSGAGHIECPLDEDGCLQEDYLMISNLPNLFNRDSLESDHRILNFGGTHREGTEAVLQLVEDADVLSELQTKLQGLRRDRTIPPYWQALIHVNCANRAPMPTRVGMEVAEIEIDMAQLRKEADDYSHALRQVALG